MVSSFFFFFSYMKMLDTWTFCLKLGWVIDIMVRPKVDAYDSLVPEVLNGIFTMQTVVKTLLWTW